MTPNRIVSYLGETLQYVFYRMVDNPDNPAPLEFSTNYSTLEKAEEAFNLFYESAMSRPKKKGTKIRAEIREVRKIQSWEIQT